MNKFAQVFLLNFPLGRWRPYVFLFFLLKNLYFNNHFKNLFLIFILDYFQVIIFFIQFLKNFRYFILIFINHWYFLFRHKMKFVFFKNVILSQDQHLLLKNLILKKIFMYMIFIHLLNFIINHFLSMIKLFLLQVIFLIIFNHLLNVINNFLFIKKLVLMWVIFQIHLLIIKYFIFILLQDLFQHHDLSKKKFSFSIYREFIIFINLLMNHFILLE